jgi:preprotein translocase subunit YajC
MSFFMNAAHAAGDASGAAAAPAGGGMSTMLLFAVIFGLFYMLIIRPQQKRAKTHRNMISSIQQGDEVITNGGIIGKVVSLDENYISVEIAEHVTIRLQKSYVSASLPKGTAKAAEKSK